MLLAAMALAHDLEEATQALEEERARSDQVTGRAREAFGRILSRVDAALITPAGGAAPSSSGEAGGGA
jgi:cell division protein ZapA